MNKSDGAEPYLDATYRRHGAAGTCRLTGLSVDSVDALGNTSSDEEGSAIGRDSSHLGASTGCGASHHAGRSSGRRARR